MNEVAENQRLTRFDTYLAQVNHLKATCAQHHHGHKIGTRPTQCSECQRYTQLSTLAAIITEFISLETQDQGHPQLGSLKAAHYYSVIDDNGDQQVYRASSVDKTMKLFRLYNGTMRTRGVAKRIDRCKVEIMIKYLMQDQIESERLIASLANDYIFTGMVIENDDHQLVDILTELIIE